MSKNGKYAFGLVACAILVIIISLLDKNPSDISTNVSNSTAVNRSILPGQMENTAPWQPEITHLKERLKVINLPALSEEGNALHTHQHLDIFIHGLPIKVPAGIGINEFAGFISPIHAHDTSGIIHVESPVVQKFYLGQFFDIWGLRFDADHIGGYASSTDMMFRIFLNGKEFKGDPRSIELTPHLEIALVYGSRSETPKFIPKDFSFPEKY